jgi:hypothetical protein
MENTLKEINKLPYLIELGGHLVEAEHYENLIENLGIKSLDKVSQQIRVRDHLRNIADRAVRDYLWDNCG